MELKQRLLALPAHTTLFWLDHLSLASGNKAPQGTRLRYPPQKIIQEIQRCASEHELKINLVSGGR